MGMLSFSIAVVHKVDIGLDQKLSMPDVSVHSQCCCTQNLFFFCTLIHTDLHRLLDVRIVDSGGAVISFTDSPADVVLSIVHQRRVWEISWLLAR